MNEKKNIGVLFDRIAGSYDKLNHLMSLNIDKRWRRRAVTALKKELQAAEGREVSVLDVAIGTADLAIETVREMPQARVTGIDLSGEMMRIGEEKVRKAGMEGRIRFMQASALDMPFEDGQFDAVTCGYGVRNFSDLDKGLSEMHRVLRERGELMILEFSYPRNKLIAWAYDLYFANVMPWIGKLISKDKTAYTYFYKSVRGFVWGEDMAERLREAGFKDVRYKPLTFGITTIYTAKK